MLCSLVRVMAAPSSHSNPLLAQVQALIGDVPLTLLGMSGGDRVVIDGLVDLPISELDQAWRNTLPEFLS